jgi:hypothetical protein
MYGSSRFRAYYGAGDYQRSVSYARGYYPGGGFLSGLLKKGVGLVSKVASNPLVGTALSFVPGGGLLKTGLGIAGKVLSGPIGKGLAGGVLSGAGMGLFDSAVAGAKGLMGIGGANKPAAGQRQLAAFTGGAVERGSPKRKRRSSSRRRRSSSRRSSSRRSSGRRRSRRRYQAGDARDSNGQWTSGGGPMKYPHHGHRHPPKRRRRRGGGGRVSFTTKDGRRVSFSAKRGDDA